MLELLHIENIAIIDRADINNIHRQGTTAVEAGAHIAELIKTMLEKKASGIDLARGVSA